ncbi:hypothetical protein, partial [Exiguobacterium sp. s7]|uniref:hypothetical protein n=1 Tax=Exiguobacterium sp. s7 TaxID=2751235 RepID=UPI001BEAB7B3
GQSENSNRGLSKQQLRYRGFRFFSMFNSKSDGFYASTTPYGDEPFCDILFKIYFERGRLR